MENASSVNNASIYLSMLDLQRLRSWLERATLAESASKADLDALRTKLDQAKICSPEHVPDDTVTMNSLIQVKNLHTQQSQRVKIMYPDTADEYAGQYSILTPLATALLGSRAGDVLNVRTPAGLREFLVEEIVYRPESEQAYDQ